MESKRLFYLFFGCCFVSVGAVGVFVPVLPTTPFVLVAAFCFGKSSKKAEDWILNNKYFGSYVENYRTHKGVPWNVKRNSLIFLWFMLFISAIMINTMVMYLVLIFIGLCVSVHILLLKTQEV